MELSFCNGQKRYDFSRDEGFYFPDCDSKYYSIEDVSFKAFRRAYVKALFAEDEYWLNVIDKYQMVVPGSPLNRRDKGRDQVAKEHLQEQVSPDTLKDRKAFFKAWKEASCCADNCDQYCDECSNKNIQFGSVPTFGLDADVRRYIIKYWRHATASEESENKKPESNIKTKEDTNGKRSSIPKRRKSGRCNPRAGIN